MLDVATQVIDILLLLLGITNGDGAIGDCRMGDAIGMAFIIGPDQQAIGHITGELTADIAAGADTDTLMFNFEIGFIFNITEAQRAGIQCVFIGTGSRTNHRAIKLGMLTHRDIEATRACKNTGLFLHRVIVAVQFVLTHAEVGGGAAAYHRHTHPAAGAGLLRIIIIAVLLALQQQVTADIHLDGVAAGLSTNQRGIAPAV
ncbi:Uncharacterised protein [Yersinia rohdei]|nr:Uncharacterised protein [Yersinia rohdei]